MVCFRRRSADATKADAATPLPDLREGPEVQRRRVRQVAKVDELEKIARCPQVCSLTHPETSDEGSAQIFRERPPTPHDARARLSWRRNSVQGPDDRGSSRPAWRWPATRVGADSGTSMAWFGFADWGGRGGPAGASDFPRPRAPGTPASGAYAAPTLRSPSSQ